MNTKLPHLPEWHIPAPVQGLFPALVCLVTGLADRLYLDIDNYWISIVTNGLYDPDGVTVHLHPLLSFASAALGRLLPGADGFALLTQIALVFAVWWLGTMMALYMRNRTQQLACYFALALTMFNVNLFALNFTIVSSIFGSVGLYTLLVCLRRPLGRAPVVAGLACIGLCCLWRYQVALLLLPFLFLDLVVLVLRHQVTFARTVRVLAPCAALMGVLCVIFLAFFSVSPYKEARTYSLARSSIYDFSVADWSESEEALLALGLSENDYRCLTSSVFADSEVFTGPVMQAAADVLTVGGRTAISTESLAAVLRTNAEVLWSVSLARYALILCLVLTAVALFTAKAFFLGWRLPAPGRAVV